jgi:hypothetical protein
MSKVIFSRLLPLIIVGILIFHSCAKDRGKLPTVPFNFSMVEGFESSSNLPAGWTFWNPDNDAAWQIVTTVGHNSNNCIGFNNCSGDGTTDMTGRKDRFRTAVYDLTQATNVSIAFDVAYAVFNFKSTTYTDSLAVYASTDGGSTWSQIYLKGGIMLSNIPIITTSPPCYVPAGSSDWRTDKITANNLGGHKVMLAFENRSDWGEWIYLDNITITGSNGANANCSGVTYAKSISPIMQTYCTMHGCHIAGNSAAPYDLTTYTAVQAQVSSGALKARVIDGNPTFMPNPAGIPDSLKSKIQCWLDAGSPNN